MDFQIFWNKYGDYIPLLIVSTLIATGTKIPGDFVPFFLLSIFLIAEADIHKEIHNQCCNAMISLFCLIILLCLVKHGKLSKWIAIIIVIIFFFFLVFVKKQYEIL